MGLGAVLSMMKNLTMALQPADEILAYFNEQQAKGAKLPPRLRNALLYYERSKDDGGDDIDSDDLYSFSDTSWHFLDIRDELSAHPELIPAKLEETFKSYKKRIDAAEQAGTRDWDKERAKWEKKNKRTYQPKPRPNLIGEPLD